MAINPALIKLAVQAVSSKEGRRLILISILGPVVLTLLLISLFVYVLSAPFDYLAGKFGLSDKESTALKDAQLQYADYIKPENKLIDRGGFFTYPSDGTTGSRGFSATPVPHPVLGISRPHWGQDFNSEWHSNIYSIADGRVFDMGINDEAGMYVTIYHDVDGKQFFTRYIHLSAVHAIPDGKVRQGDVIASEGGEPKKDDDTPYDYYPGTSSGHHLHFEVREGSSYSSAVPVDPKLYIDPIPVQISCKASNSSRSAANGSITVNITGGRDRGYDISKDGGTSWVSTSSKVYTINNLSSGTYMVMARDASYTDNKSSIAAVTVSSKPEKPEDKKNKNTKEGDKKNGTKK